MATQALSTRSRAPPPPVLPFFPSNFTYLYTSRARDRRRYASRWCRKELHNDAFCDWGFLRCLLACAIYLCASSLFVLVFMMIFSFLFFLFFFFWVGTGYCKIKWLFFVGATAKQRIRLDLAMHLQLRSLYYVYVSLIYPYINPFTEFHIEGFHNPSSVPRLLVDPLSSCFFFGRKGEIPDLDYYQARLIAKLCIVVSWWTPIH